MSDPQPQATVVVVPSSRKPALSKWWWISLLFGWVVLLIVGGGLVGAWVANACTPSYSYYYYSSYSSCSSSGSSDSLLYGGVACFAIGGVLHLAYWVFLIVWCTQRRRIQADGSGVTFVSVPVVEGGVAKSEGDGLAYPPPHPTPVPNPVHQ